MTTVTTLFEDQQLTHGVTLSTVSCGKCGGVYAIQENFRAQCLLEATGWNCPYCKTSWGYFGKTKAERDTERLERQLEAERSAHARTRDDRDFKEYQRRAEKGHRTRLQKDLKTGTCPCCGSIFKNLRRHMTKKHPEFGAER